MKIIQIVLTIWSGLLLLCFYVLIPLKESLINNIFGTIIYILTAAGLIVWVINDSNKQLDEDLKKILIVLYSALFMVIVTFFNLLICPRGPAFKF
jgi:Kef-type K+ transport system membrane component KefB